MGEENDSRRRPTALLRVLSLLQKLFSERLRVSITYQRHYESGDKGIDPAAGESALCLKQAHRLVQQGRQGGGEHVKQKEKSWGGRRGEERLGGWETQGSVPEEGRE